MLRKSKTPATRRVSRQRTDAKLKLAPSRAPIVSTVKQKGAKETFPESEGRFRALIEHGHDAIALFGADGAILYASPSTVRVMGYLPEELVHRNALEFIHPDWQDAVREQLAESLRRPGIAIPSEGYIRHKDGNWRFLEGTFTNFLKEPSIGAIVNNYRDITERKQAEEKLRASEEKYRALVTEISDGIFASDERGTLTYANSTLARILGFESPEQLIGKSFFEFVAPAKLNEVAGYFNHAIESGQTRETITVQAVRLDGTKLVLEIKSVVIKEDGKVAGLRGVVRDVSERRLTEEALRESESRYRLLFENMVEGFSLNEILTDENGQPIDFRILEANVAYEFHTGLKAQEIVGKTIREIMPQVDPSQIQNYGNVALTGKPLSFEYFSKTFNRYFRVTAFCPQLKRFATIFEDITERKRAEEALVASYRESERLRAHNSSIIETMAEGLLVEDPAGIINFVNPRMCDMLGYATDEILGKNWKTIVAESEWEHVAAESTKRLVGITTAYESRLVRKDGTEIPVLISGTPLRLSGEYAGVIATFADIGERKRAEQSIADALSYNQLLLETSPVGVITYKATGAAVSANEAVARIIGATVAQIQAQNFREIESWRKSGLYDLAEHALATNRVVEKDIQITTTFGKTVWLSARFVPFVFKSEQHLLGLFADIMERKRAEEEINRRAEEFEALYETAHDLSMQLDLTLLLRTIAERAAHLLHASRGSIHFYHAAPQELEFAISSDAAITVGNRLKLGEGLAGKVAESRKTIIVDHYSQWEHRSIKPGLIGMESAIGAPMIYNGNLIGVITVGELAPTDRKFTDAEAQLVSLFATHAASAIYNARLFDETQRRVEQLSTFNEIGKAVSAQLQLESALETIFQQVKRILSLDTFYVALFNAETKMLSYPFLYDAGKRYDQPASPPKKGTEIQRVIETREPIMINRAPAEIAAPVDAQFLIGDNSKRSASLLFMPLQFGAHLIGVMSAQSYTLNAYTAEHLTLLSGIANQVAIAIENARLYRETQRNLARVESLHQIDRAISSSLDLTVTMNTFLAHATVQLGVDAADILRLDQNTHLLEFVAGIGFRTKALQHTHLQLGDGLAGKAAVERKMIALSNLSSEIDGLARSPSIQSEGFVAYYAVPLIAKGRVNGVMEIFQRTPTDNDQSWLDYLNTLAGQAAIALDNTELYQNLQQANTDLGMAYDATILGWSNALDLRDHETQGHTLRVTEMSLRLARTMGVNETELIHLRRGALLHDIGKMGVPDEILHKPGALTDSEWEIMHQHPDLAYRLLSPIEYLRPALDIPYCHHEKWDGTGYPRGLWGEQIPLVARIFAVVDVWDALGSDRPYRKAWSEKKVIEHLQSETGKHFDPRIVEIFLRTLESRV